MLPMWTSGDLSCSDCQGFVLLHSNNAQSAKPDQELKRQKNKGQ